MNTFQDLAPRGTEQGVFMDFFRSMAGVFLVSVLAACGGGTGEQVQDADMQRASASSAAETDLTRGRAKGLDDPSYGKPLGGVDLAEMKQRLAKRFNGRFAGQPEALMGERQKYASAKAFQSVAKAYGGAPSSVHRFLNTLTGAHFYTMSAEEKASIERNLPQFRYEGQAFFALTSSDVPLSPVYRFYSVYTGTHFYTINPEERDYVLQYYWEYFSYEGVAWYATVFEGPGWVPMHRFYNLSAGTHFYTTSEDEKQRVMATLPFMEYEGIGYYVRADGTTVRQSPVAAGDPGAIRPCVQEENPTGYVLCGAEGALPLVWQVEGRREPFSTDNPRFVAVPGQSFDDCAVDRFTGLAWEMKTNGGPRDLVRRFTHLDRTDQPQVVVRTAGGASGAFMNVPRNPSQVELEAASNSLGYVSYVNSQALCGFTDWRIPTSSELLNLMYLEQRSTSLPSAWGRFISSDTAAWDFDETDEHGQPFRRRVDGLVSVGRDDGNPYVGQNPANHGFRAVEEGGQLSTAAKYHLVLVRGTPRAGPSRFSAMSIGYGSDAAGNVLLDNWSGLQWRRCVEGQTWTGSSCSGTPVKVHLGGALAWAANRPGWRLAGAKELESLQNHQSDLTQVRAYTQLFPVTGMGLLDLPFWSMTMFRSGAFVESPVGSGQYSYSEWVDAYVGQYGATEAGSMPKSFLQRVPATTLGYVRLVRVHP